MSISLSEVLDELGSKYGGAFTVLETSQPPCRITLSTAGGDFAPVTSAVFDVNHGWGGSAQVVLGSITEGRYPTIGWEKIH